MAQRIGRYEVVETLGKGGMGVVYRARDPELGRDVAIKVVLAWAQYDPDAMERFNREARVVAQLQHPHIVTVFDAGRTEDDLPYFVMEYLEGTDLGEVLGMAGTLAPSRALRYALQVCDGLSYAHAREIVHRDIKPANLLITPDDSLKIVDFGIARLAGSQITGTGMSLGTPLYMAPEQVAGKQVDHRADVFALGGVLYTLLAGESPFEAPTLGGICHKIETQAPRSLSERGLDIPRRLEAIILRSLEKDPAERYQSAEALAADLRSVQGDVEAAATAPTVITPSTARVSPTTRTERIGPRDRKPGRAVALAALAMIAAAAALWAFPELRPWTSEQEPQGLGESETPIAEETDSSAIAATEPDDTTAGAAERQESEVAAVASDTESETTTASGGETAVGAAAAQAAPATDAPATVEAPGAVSDAPATRDEDPPAISPASESERQQVNRVVAALIRAIEAKDSVAIARAYGGRIPDRDQRFYGRMLRGPRMRIRYELAGVGVTDNGAMVAEVRSDILSLGQPGSVPAPRKATWVMRFQSDKTGLYLLGIRAR
jgi:serine/threonine-protein kinase